MKLRILADAAALAGVAAIEIVREAGQAVRERGEFHLMLAGGSTPEHCYRLLQSAEIDWSRLHIWFGDERCLPKGDSGRNDSMARQALFDHVPIPTEQVHAIPAELGAEQGAEAYAALLERAPAMDLVLLGMGEDGHTASLFPGQPALADERLAVPVFNAPKAPAERVSVGMTILNRARRCLMLVSGAGKSEALGRIRAGERLPAVCVERCEWLVDAATWGEED